MRLSELGEDGFIARLRERIPRPGPAVRLGIGDDAAALVLPPSEDLLVSTDVLVEGVHFTRTTVPLRYVGRKAVAVNASDIAAMGGRPLALLCSLASRPDMEVEELLELYTGLIGRATELGLDVIGGNLSATPGPLVLDATIVGTTSDRKLLKRSGARPGEALYVSGRLGRAAAGLRFLAEGAVLSEAGELRVPPGWHGAPLPVVEACLRAHLDPEPRIALGQFLCRRGLASACMDLSDGLARDLPRLCEASRVGCLVDEAALPVYSTGKEEAAGALALALSGGEDYELLFSTGEETSLADWGAESDLPLTRIGRLSEPEAGIRLRSVDGGERPLAASGWDHFLARPGE
jgi:thiamine-monophosphate kinase